MVRIMTKRTKFPGAKVFIAGRSSGIGKEIAHLQLHQGAQVEIASCLKQGGALVIATPDAGHYLQRVMGSRWPMLQPMQHLCILSRNSLRMILEQAHLEVRKMGVATKTITLSYLVDQLRTLNPVLYGALKAVLRLTPTAIKHRQRQVNIGEILAIAVKN